MKKLFALLAVSAITAISWTPAAHSIPCEATTFLNGKCKSEIIGGQRYYYCGSVLAGEKPNCTIYVGK
jgi:hypothetical protein